MDESAGSYPLLCVESAMLREGARRCSCNRSGLPVVCHSKLLDHMTEIHFLTKWSGIA